MSSLKAIAKKGNITNLVNTTSTKALIDLIYPIGSIYVSISTDFDPSVAWPGTSWEKIVDGKYLRATDLNEQVGVEVAESLPNVIGTVGRWVSISNTTDGKAFKTTWAGNMNGYGGSGGYQHCYNV